MGKLSLAIGLAITSFIVLAACTRQISPPSESSGQKQLISVKQEAKETWEEEWDKLVVAAKKEGKLTLYGFVAGESRMVMEKAFKERYGLSMEIITAGASEITAKIMSERKAGLYLVDVMLSGPTEMATILKPAGALESLDNMLLLPEVKSPQFWEGGKLPFMEPEHTIFTFQAYPSGGIVINTNLVMSGEITSARHLLNPKWKNKILLSDITSGSGSTYVSVVGPHGLGWDYLRELAKQEPLILKDYRQTVEWVAQGKYAILIAPKTETFNDFKRAGAPIALVMLPDTAYTTGGTGSITMMKNAPHPNAAKLFINWFLSKEGITVYSKSYGSHTLRKDVPTDFLNPLHVRDPKISYFDTDTLEFRLKKPEYIKQAVEIFGHLMR